MWAAFKIIAPDSIVKTHYMVCYNIFITYTTACQSLLSEKPQT